MLAALNEFVTTTIADHGVWAIFLLMLVESACIPMPSEVTMLYGGYLVHQGDASFVGVVAAGVFGNLIGSWLIYYVGLFGGRTLLIRHGRWVGVKVKHVEQADHWFERHGNQAVFIGRILPVVRTFISLPAGVARMPIVPFTIYTFVGCTIWVAALTGIGVALGPHWETAHEALHHLDELVIAAIVLGLLYLAFRHLKKRRAPRA
jgi:membrane protein DedA with SNARE-associated domain